MWLKSLQVHCFGALRDREWPDLTPGLNLFFGPNEAGKTTLMMFLRGMLFGFTKSPYDSLDNSEPGGSLRLLDARGREWTLERRGRGKKARILASGPQGVIQGEEALRPLLQDVNRPVYENIFAFSLKELQDLETLTKPREVKHLLYSASLGLGPVSLKAVEDRLHKQIDDLFKTGRRAVNPEINQILAELARVRQEIQELEQQPRQYQELQGEQARLEGEIQRLAREEAAAKEEALWLEKLCQAAKVWEEWRLAREALAAIPPVDSFPEDGLARLEKIQVDLAQVEQQLERWTRELATARAEASRQGPEPHLLQAAVAVEALAEERLRFSDRREELQQVESKKNLVRSRLEERLARLGSEWDESRLAGFQPSLNWQISLQEHQQRLEAAAAAGRHAEDQRRLRRETLEEKESARDKWQQAGIFIKTGLVFTWGFAALFLALGLGAGTVYFWKPGVWNWVLAAGAAISAAAVLVQVLWLKANHRRRLQELEEDRQAAAAALNAAESHWLKENEKSARLRDEWREWLQKASLDPELSPTGAAAFLQETAAARSLLQEWQDLAGAEKELQDYLQDFTARLGEVLAGLGRPAVAPARAGAVLPELRQEVAAALKLEEQQLQLIQKIAETEQEAAAWEARKKHLLTARDHLLAAAGEQEEEGFRRRAAIFAEGRELTRKTRELAARLRLLAGDEAKLAQLQADLERLAPGELEERRNRAESHLKELHSRLAEAFQQQGRLKNLIEGLEQADALSRALLSEQTLAARLQDTARRWTVATLAGYFLEQARRRFEAEYQPQVLRRASHYFALLTEGRYPQVMAPLEGESFLVIDRQGRHLPPERLSRGTGEQLYLALRFALIREYSQEGRSLPLILDDILVNFDQARARQAIRLFQEMSASHQLLLFTCHPHILNLIRETLGPAAPTPLLLEEKEEN